MYVTILLRRVTLFNSKNSPHQHLFMVEVEAMALGPRAACRLGDNKFFGADVGPEARLGRGANFGPGKFAASANLLRSR